MWCWHLLPQDHLHFVVNSVPEHFPSLIHSAACTSILLFPFLGLDLISTGILWQASSRAHLFFYKEKTNSYPTFPPSLAVDPFIHIPQANSLKIVPAANFRMQLKSSCRQEVFLILFRLSSWLHSLVQAWNLVYNSGVAFAVFSTHLFTKWCRSHQMRAFHSEAMTYLFL